MYPRQSSTTHTEHLGHEASVYDWARSEVHALNSTAARVWQLCDGATSRDAIAAVLRVEMGIPEAEAVVDLTLTQLARVHLLELPVESRVDSLIPTRRWLLRRGLAAAILPAIYSIAAPSPVEAQSPVGAPTLTNISPNQGGPGTTVPVTLTGTNFIGGATTVNVNSGGVSATNVVVISTTSLTADIVIAAAPVIGAHTVSVTTSHGTSGTLTFTVNPPAPGSTPFAFTGGPQAFTVPAGVVSITIQATGAAGADGPMPSGGVGGLGGGTTATVSVTPGASLTVLVGGVGLASDRRLQRRRRKHRDRWRRRGRFERECRRHLARGRWRRRGRRRERRLTSSAHPRRERRRGRESHGPSRSRLVRRGQRRRRRHAGRWWSWGA